MGNLRQSEIRLLAAEEERASEVEYVLSPAQGPGRGRPNCLGSEGN